MATVNVKNYFEQPTVASGNDNALVLNGTVKLNGSSIDASKLGYVSSSNDVIVYTGAGTITISGIALIQGGTGFNMTLAAPKPGVHLEIRVTSITSGNVVVTTASGVTFDGTNNTATFNAANDYLTLGYKSATQWIVIVNNSVALSSV